MSRAKNIINRINKVDEGGKEISQTILKQLGGNKFIAMTGAKNLGYSDNSLSFKIGKNKSKATHVEIEYDRGKDLYNMIFFNIRGTDVKELKKCLEFL